MRMLAIIATGLVLSVSGCSESSVSETPTTDTQAAPQSSQASESEGETRDDFSVFPEPVEADVQPVSAARCPNVDLNALGPVGLTPKTAWHGSIENPPGEIAVKITRCQFNYEFDAGDAVRCDVRLYSQDYTMPSVEIVESLSTPAGATMVSEGRNTGWYLPGGQLGLMRQDVIQSISGVVNEVIALTSTCEDRVSGANVEVPDALATKFDDEVPRALLLGMLKD